MQKNNKVLSSDFITTKWRPMMAWVYMTICFIDMIIFPILWTIAEMLTKSSLTQWSPLTLQGGGLFHLSMGAVLGVTAYGRTMEKRIFMQHRRAINQYNNRN